MALLIYKQWHRNANLPQTPTSNSNNIRYIGERVHVLKDDTKANGLFGKIEGKYFNDLDTDTVCGRVNEISKRGITMFRSVISFTPERAELLELGTDKSRWENYVKSNVRTIAEKNGIDVTGLEWVAAVHYKRGQPHVHINFWNTKQVIGINRVDAELCNDIREKLEADTFSEIAEDRTILDDGVIINDNSDEVRRALITNTFANEKNALHELQDETLQRLKAESRDKFLSDELIEKFVNIADSVPKHGQLAYAYMPDEVKELIKDFIQTVLQLNPELKEMYDEYISLKREESEMYNSEESNIGKYNIVKAVGHAIDKLEKVLGNLLLKEIKKYNFERRVTQNSDEAKKAHTVYAAIALCDHLTRLFHTYQSASVLKTTRVDLSKDAKRELRYKYADKEAREQ